MTDREAFLAAIIANPADDLPRLVYADWLEENGETERAFFIREQIAGISSQCPFLHDDLVIYKRGFIHAIRGTIGAILEHGPTICQEHPVEEVEVLVAEPLVEFYSGDSVERAARTAPNAPPYLGIVTGGHMWQNVGSEIDRQLRLSEPLCQGGMPRYLRQEEAILALNAAVLTEIRELAAIHTKRPRGQGAIPIPIQLPPPAS